MASDAWKQLKTFSLEALRELSFGALRGSHVISVHAPNSWGVITAHTLAVYSLGRYLASKIIGHFISLIRYHGL
jgi:hypothetical protein